MRENGVVGTTLDDVRSRAGSSKGQLFHYFPGRQGGAAARGRAARGRPGPRRPAAPARSADLLGRVARMARPRGRALPRPGDGLPAQRADVGQVGRSTPGARAVVTTLMGAVAGAGAPPASSTLQAAGEVAADLDADRTAAAMIASIQGGVGLLMSHRRARSTSRPRSTSSWTTWSRRARRRVESAGDHRPDAAPLSTSAVRAGTSSRGATCSSRPSVSWPSLVLVVASGCQPPRGRTPLPGARAGGGGRRPSASCPSTATSTHSRSGRSPSTASGGCWCPSTRSSSRSSSR